MDQLPSIVRARMNAAPAGDHPDPDLLTAFAEQALADQERSKVLSHLSHCADCREVLALATSSLSTPALADAAAPIDTTRRVPWFRWPVLRWGAVAACLVIVGSAVLMKRDLMMTRQVKIAADQAESTSTYPAQQKTSEPPALSATQAARPQASVSSEQAGIGALTAYRRIQQDKKTVQPQPPVASPVPSGRMKPEFAYSGSRADAAAPAGILGGATKASNEPPASPRNEQIANLPVEEKKVAHLDVVPKAPETVEVTAAASAIGTDTAGLRAKQELPGKAKPPSGTALYDALVAAPAVESTAQPAFANEIARKAEMKRAESYRPPVSRWTISSDGQLQHSVDSGKTWQPVAVADYATFRALSANGPDLWVGGASGLLYHSTDAGAHWAQVKPTTAGASLTADIAAIEFTDVRQGKITTSTGEVWLTKDAGQTWHKQP
jgi:hypothetical protein